MAFNRPTAALARSPIFTVRTEGWSIDDRAAMTYRRAKAILQHYNLTADDILHLSPRYWQFHTDPILPMDLAVGTILTIHVNLCSGTLAMFTAGRPDTKQILDKLLSFQLVGNYCLTELGRGLDARNLQTRATLLPNGEIELHTPDDAAAKFMPPTTPCGIPSIAVVFARLISGGEDYGVRPFAVPIHDGKQMYPGITSKLLTPRGGSRPVKHAITYFDRVRLPGSALLGDHKGKPLNVRSDFFFNISRVITGTISMGALGVGGNAIAAYVAARYSLRRTVTDAATGKPRPIASFPTQHAPILAALSQSFVLNAFSARAHAMFTDKSSSLQMKHFIAAVYKITVMKYCHANTIALADRCGAQGLFEVNQMNILNGDLRGAAIAEGDTLTLAIRFTYDLLLGRIEPIPFIDSEGLLAQHESGLISHLKATLTAFNHHRNPELETKIFPQCTRLIEAIGCRLAYEAAIAANVDPRMLDIFLINAIKADSVWYSENANMRHEEQLAMESAAISAALPYLEDYVDALGIDAYITAPIVSEDRWAAHVAGLETFKAPSSHGLSLVEPIQATARL